MEKRHETIEQVLFWAAVDEYLQMDQEVRKKLETIIKFDHQLGSDEFAEIINISQAFPEVPPDKTVKAIVAVLLKVVEHAAKVKSKGQMLHVGCLCVSHRPEVVESAQGKMKMERENVFIPVKMI